MLGRTRIDYKRLHLQISKNKSKNKNEKDFESFFLTALPSPCHINYAWIY